MSLSALSNIRILDFSRILAAPYASMILSDLGAVVWKIEKPGTGDHVRSWNETRTAGGESCYHLLVNRNKKSIAIDLKQPAGQRLVRKLASKCDVLLENFKPGVMEKLGLDYKTLSSENERLIYCSITGFGPEGPLSKRDGYDVIAEAIGGFMDVNSSATGDFQQATIPLIDVMTGLYAHGAILTALLQRNQTGKGQKIECNLLATQMAALLNAASYYLNSGVKNSKTHLQQESILPYQAFQTKDGRYFAIAVGTDQAFKTLCYLIGRPKIARDPRFRSTEQRFKNKNALLKLLTKRFLEKDLAYWEKTMKDESLACAPVNNLEEAFDHPQVKSLNLVQEMYHEKMGPMKVIGPVVQYSEAVNRIRNPPPVLGEHTKEILKYELAVKDNELEELKRSKIIQY